MPDVVDRATRSRMMAGIKGKDTRPEIFIRHGLHRLGLRYLLHSTKISGKPDLAFPKYRCLVFVHGCFWHMHDCRYFHWPQTNIDFWKVKLQANAARDVRHIDTLLAQGWRIAIVWECAVKSRSSQERDNLVSRLANWIRLTETSEPRLQVFQ